MEIIQPLKLPKSRSAVPNIAADTGFLLVGHGTRIEAGQRQFHQLFEFFQTELAPAVCEMAFLELAKPDISQAVERLATQGARSIITVPALLFAAGHALTDIPSTVQQAASRHRISALQQSGALELMQPIVELSTTRFREVVCPLVGTAGFESANAGAKNAASEHGEQYTSQQKCHPSAPACSGCENRICRDVALLLIGRGSSSASAAERMREFTAARCEITRVAWNQTAFLHAQFPDLDEGLNQLRNTPHRIKVVQPHLLFEGQLVCDLRQRVDRMRSDNPEQTWLITEVLGADRQLAQTLASLAKAADSTNQSSDSRVEEK